MGISTNTDAIYRTGRLIARDARGRKAVGVVKITVDDDPVVLLSSIPESANCALLCVEADSTAADKTKVIRFYEDGTAPTSTDGFPLGNLDFYEIDNRANMFGFKMIGIEAAKTHTIQVLYYA